MGCSGLGYLAGAFTIRGTRWAIVFTPSYAPLEPVTDVFMFPAMGPPASHFCTVVLALTVSSFPQQNLDIVVKSMTFDFYQVTEPQHQLIPVGPPN